MTLTHTLEVPGNVLTYDIQKNESSTQPMLMMVGSPMGASGFDTLAGFFADRTIVTYDPRGVERSRRTDDAKTSTTEQHADDIHRVIAAVGGGPVDMFASSGGAVNALALVARHPNDVRILVAHEPPDAAVLPDRDAALAAVKSIADAYQRSGFGEGMARFIAVTAHRGPFPVDPAEIQGPSAAQMGLPSADDGSRDDPLLGQNIGSTVRYEPDYMALRAAPTRVVMAVGAASDGQMTSRATAVIAERLGTTPVVFPGGHGGFNQSEWDPTSDPRAFAAKLREVLDS